MAKLREKEIWEEKLYRRTRDPDTHLGYSAAFPFNVERFRERREKELLLDGGREKRRSKKHIQGLLEIGWWLLTVPIQEQDRESKDEEKQQEKGSAAAVTPQGIYTHTSHKMSEVGSVIEMGFKHLNIAENSWLRDIWLGGWSVDGRWECRLWDVNRRGKRGFVSR
ncbi:hypothetical protein F2Q70_00042770 [Brassica cretica]|uniref:Uncharacterized protein n=1 Tax=Brassica cretica TaxID=69181 RepID=A0A8S9KFH2_BRACR|nr:hypothetical protein F2Q70_00042770 [Brassica cretica]